MRHLIRKNYAPEFATLLAVALCFTAHAALQLVAPGEAAQEPSVFRSGTRLVEIDAVVRGKNGPIKGLTKDDFTLYDCNPQQRGTTSSPCKGKRQPLDIFREVDGAPSPPALALASGVVSNRSGGAAATVVLLDQLNTPFDLKAYERLRVAEFLRTIGDQHRIALYSLGQRLQLLEDFTNDPEKLMAAVAKADSGDQTAFARDSADVDPAFDREIKETQQFLKYEAFSHGEGEMKGLEEVIQAEMKGNITTEAIKAIIRHMEGVPGRKSLVWIAQSFRDLVDRDFGPPNARTLLAQANIAVYPVMVYTGPHPSQEYWRDFGKSVGGLGFDDAQDALKAVRTAEEDSNNYYVLGFYPAEADLDGKKHQLTLEVSSKALSSKGVVKSALDLRYKQVYLATKSGSAEEQSAITDILHRPLDASTIGLTAVIAPDPTKPGARRIEVTVDLANVQLQRQDDRWVGSLKVALRLESMEKGALMVTPPVTGTAPINVPDAELEAKRASGFVIVWPLARDAKPGSAHVVIQDTANGAAGSVRVPIPSGK